MLTDAVREAARRSVLCWLATVDAEGQPNVSPKEVWTIADDQHVVVAHIASPISARNISQHPQVCLSFIDVFVQKGWKLLGRAQYVHSSDAVFSGYAKPLLPMAGDQFNIQGVFLVTVEQAHPIIAPSYRFFSRHHHGASAN